MALPQILLQEVRRPFAEDAGAPVGFDALEEAAVESTSKLIDFELQAQPADLQNWCWAAVATSISNKYDGFGLTQCAVAEKVLAPKACCADRKSCDEQVPLPQALKENLEDGPLSVLEFSKVEEQISQDRLVCFRVEFDGFRGHFVVVSGYEKGPAGEQVVVQDPIGPTTATLPYQDFRNRYQATGRCTHSYLTKPA